MDKYSEIRVPIAHDNPSIKRRESKCVLCGKCKDVCKKKIGVAGYWTYDSEDIVCINCGQCANVCPVESIVEQDDTQLLLDAIKDENKIVILMTSPAVRVSLGEAFDLPMGEFVAGKMVSSLKKLGANYVFDVTTGADLTIMEEASELIDRIQNGKTLPQFTSCCPAWVKFVETFYPQYIPNLSSCKSPISMLSSMVKNYFANEKNIDPKNIYLVAVTPCVAKKFEIKRPELSEFYGRDTDLVITAREMARLLKKQKINLKAQKDSEFDEFFPTGSGAGVIFGTSGGVMEAAVRTAYYMTTGENPPKDLLHFKKLRGYTDIKTAKVNLCGKEVKLCVIFGTNAARSVLDKLKTKNYDMIEVMACPNGCVGGGGQPKQYDNDTAVTKRGDALYNADENMSVKSCHENESIQRVYQNFLTSPLSDKAKKYLHTTYVKR
ncbi:MAG: hydrogenase [Clostridiales bacterium]|nr:hydrogenase [Clostridiales bacterium]